MLATTVDLTAFSGTTDNYSWNSNKFVMQTKWTTRPLPSVSVLLMLLYEAPPFSTD